MDLKQALENMSPNQKVKIGAKQGTGWFYCGTAKRFLDNVTEYDAEIRNKWTAIVAKAWHNLERAMEQRRGLVAIDDIRRWAKNIVQKCDRIDTVTRTAKSYTPIDEREVLSIREADKTIDEDTVNIMIAGHEYGAFWCFDEAKRAKKHLSMQTEEEYEE